MFGGMFLGILIYMIFFSSHIIKINVAIITFIKSILKKIFRLLIFPFLLIYKFLKKIFFKPIKIFIINIKKISTKLCNKINFPYKKSKKLVKN